MTELYRFADTTVSVSSVYDEVHHLCADYRTLGEADFAVQTSISDIEFERIKTARQDKFARIAQRQSRDEYLETLAVYRKIAERMPDFDTVLFHGSCIAVEGSAYLFTAKSGTGKSTHARLWREMLGSRAHMINDDKPLLRIREKEVVVYGTPWDGKHRLSTNTAVPLKAICILEQAKDNSIREITKAEALPMLLQQAYRPADSETMHKTLTLIDRLRVRFYRLACNMDCSAAQLAFNTMKEG